jgi:hypothetical protein
MQNVKRQGARLQFAFCILQSALVASLLGCSKGGNAPAPPPTAPSKAGGWEIKYTATVALARRGSDLAKDHFDTLEEMLDEEQQQANCKVRNRDGREIVNEPAATSNVTTALKALIELHRRKPDLDLSKFNPAIQKLLDSKNPLLRTEAEKTRAALQASK